MNQTPNVTNYVRIVEHGGSEQFRFIPVLGRRSFNRQFLFTARHWQGPFRSQSHSAFALQTAGISHHSHTDTCWQASGNCLVSVLLNNTKFNSCLNGLGNKSLPLLVRKLGVRSLLGIRVFQTTSCKHQGRHYTLRQ